MPAKKKTVAKKKAIVSKPRILILNADNAEKKIKALKKIDRKAALIDPATLGWIYKGKDNEEPVFCLSYVTPKPLKDKVKALVAKAALRSGVYALDGMELVEPISEILKSTDDAVISAPPAEVKHEGADSVKAANEDRQTEVDPLDSPGVEATGDTPPF